MLPSLFKSLAGSAGIRLLGMGFGFLVGIQLARGLGVEGYGVYGLVMSIISLLMIPVEFGLPQLLTREVAAARVKNDESLISGLLGWADRAVLTLSFGVTFLTCVGGYFYYMHSLSGVVWALLVGLPLVPLGALVNLRSAAAMGLQHVVKGQMSDVVLKPAAFSILLWTISVCCSNLWNPTVVMFAQVVAMLLTLLASSLFLRTLIPKKLSIKVARGKSLQWRRSALPMALTEGMRVVHANSSLLLLGVFSATAAVGVFRVATSVSVLLSMPVSLMHVVCAPAFSRLHVQKDHHGLQVMLSRVSAVMVVGVGVLTLPVLFWGEQILEGLFGPGFGQSVIPLLILSLGVMTGSALGPGATLLNMTGHEKRVTYASLWSLVVLVSLAVPLVVFWGETGAAVANSLTFVFWSGLMWWDSRKLLGVDSSVFQLLKLKSD